MDCERDDATRSSTNLSLYGLGAVTALFAIVAVGPSTVAAQDLPTVDELESSNPDEESTAQKDEGGESEEDGEDEASEESTDSSQGDASEESADDSEGDDAQPPVQQRDASDEEPAVRERDASDGSTDMNKAFEDGDSEEGADEDGADQNNEQGDKQGKTDKKADAESGASEKDGQDADGEDGETEDDKPGKVVEETTETDKELAGRAGGEHPRRVQGGLNADGVPGFQHMTSAEPRKTNTYTVSFVGEISSASNVIRAQDTNSFVGGQLSIHAQPIKYFSANLSLGARNNVNNFGRPEAMLSQGDLSLGLRGHYSPVEYIDLGADLTIDTPTGFGSAGIDFSGTSVRPRLLGTLDVNPLIEDMDIPLRAHLNLGYRVDNTQNMVPEGVELTRVERYAHGISAYNSFEFGLGAEYDLPFVTPFLSWNFSAPVAGAEGICSGNQPLDCASEAGFASFPDVLSFGVKAEPVEQLLLQAGLDLSLSGRDAAGVPTTPPYMLVLGASWAVDPEPKIERITKHTTVVREVEKMPPRGHLVVSVVDSQTGDPVGGAQIEYPGTERTPQVTGSDNGQLRSYGFEPETEVTMRITHPDYRDKKVTKTIKEGDQETEVKVKAATGKITGTVKGPGGEVVSGATVRAVGPESKETTTDETGAYSVSVEPGSYTVAVTASNYLANGDETSVEVGTKNSIDVSLKAAPDERVAVLDGDKIKLEDARVAFETGSAELKGDSKSTLDQVAAVLFEHPELARIEVQGHTDNAGSKEKNQKISEDRARAVKDYLVEQGIAPDRLVPKGYGPEKPKVPNITPENRKINRRVEFKVLDRR